MKHRYVGLIVSEAIIIILLLIGVALIGEGLDLHIPKGYIYFAMAFSVLVEMINLRVRKTPGPPTRLRKTYTPA